MKHPEEFYFLSRQKFGLFGIIDERTNMHTFYCAPEKELCNVVLSYIYNYLMRSSIVTKKHVYDDNCGAQNKNNYILYFV